MRICYVITRGDNIGGAQIHVRDFSRFMKESGHSVHVLVGNSGAFTEDLDTIGVPWTRIHNLERSLNPFKDGAVVREIKQRLRELTPDLVSSHGSKAGFAARLAARSLGIKNIFTAHGWAFTDGVPFFPRFLYLWAEKWLASKADRIVTVSQNDYDLALKGGVSRPPQMIRIHNGLPFLPRPEPRMPEKPFRWISVARFQDQKDHETLFAALSGLSGHDWSLELIGDGPLEEKFRSLALKIGLEDRISFLGQRKDVAQRLECADGFLLISHWEGFPRSIIEAMRASLPVIASDVGGVRESVTDGQTGFLVARRDVHGLVSQMKKLMDDTALARRLGSRGREVYEARFTFQVMFEKTLDVYREVLGIK